MEYFCGYDSPLGPLVLSGSDTAITALSFGNCPVNRDIRELPDVFIRASAWLDDYFRGEPGAPDFPLAPVGTAFQKLIWHLLLEIPFGRSRTYAELARDAARLMGKEKMSAQAVGQAVGHNPVNIIIPCHRILGAGGKLAGYSCGIHRKMWLLRHENCRDVTDASTYES